MSGKRLSLIKHPSLSCYYQCTFWSHQRFFHWDNPCTAVYHHPCKPTWKQDQPCHQHEDIFKLIAQYSKPTKKCNRMWCIQPIECMKKSYFWGFFLKVIFIPRSCFSQRFDLFGYFVLWDAANECNHFIPEGAEACCKTRCNDPLIQYKRVSR